MNKQYSFAKFLIDRGADPNVVDASGRTALYAIVEIRNEDWTTLPNRKTDDPLPSLEIVKVLLARKAESEHAAQPASSRPERDGFRRHHARRGHDAADASRKIGRRAVHAVASGEGRRPKARHQGGNNALMFAAGVGYRDKNTAGTESRSARCVEGAIEAGLDLQQANNRGETALHGAATAGADTIVQFLVDVAQTEREEQAGIHAAGYRDGKGERCPVACSKGQHRGPAAKTGWP